MCTCGSFILLQFRNNFTRKLFNTNEKKKNEEEEPHGRVVKQNTSLTRLVCDKIQRVCRQKVFWRKVEIPWMSCLCAISAFHPL